MKNDAASHESALPEITGYGLEGDAQQAFLYAVTGQTPWWVISVLLHGLVITLAGLLTISMELPDEEFLVQTTEFFKPKELAPLPENKPEPANALGEGNPLAPACLEGTKELPPLVIPLEMLQNALWGEKLEVPGPNGVEDGSAQGDLESGILLPRQISADSDLGGGGNDGLAVMEDLVGIGTGSIGHGGGWGGGDGGGIGPGQGDGVKGFGWPNRKPSNRLVLVRIYNPPGSRHNYHEVEDSLGKALRWLAAHQEYDGHWDAVKYSATVKTDTAVSALALLTFLGAGNTERVGECKDNVRRAVAWLKSKQSADGCIWDTSDDGAHHRRVGYPCAIATLALAEAAGMANVPETKAAAQKAIDYCTQIHQSGSGGGSYDKGGWRYAPKEPGDLSVTGWFIMALKSAKVAGLKVPASAFDGAIRFLDSVEVKDAGGGSGYGVASHYKYQPNDEHSQSAHRLSAIGNLARQFLGWKKEELQASVEWFVNRGGVPAHGANGEQTDLYYWYYGSMCVFQQGGELFKRWNEAMKSALIPYQCLQGDDTGSWNPAGEFCGEWGRVGQTALSALCLEVFWRYGLVYGP